MVDAEGGFGTQGGGGLLADIGENVTNEAMLCENTSTAENHNGVHVTATSDGVLGLDNLETKPAGGGGACRAEGGGRRAEEIVGTEERGRKAEDGLSAQGDGGFVADVGENVTNEATLCENASTSETHKSVQVTANSDEVLGLDSVRTKPTGAGRRAEEMVGTEEKGRRRGRDEEAEVRELQAFIASGMAQMAALGVPAEELMRRLAARSPAAMELLGALLAKGP